MVPPIVCENEEKEDMTTNLRVGFKERQSKRLPESITIISPPSKRPCLEPLCPEPVLAIALTLVPSIATANTNLELDERLLLAEGAAHHEQGRPSSGQEHPSDEFVECVAFVPS